MSDNLARLLLREHLRWTDKPRRITNVKVAEPPTQVYVGTIGWFYGNGTYVIDYPEPDPLIELNTREAMDSDNSWSE